MKIEVTYLAEPATQFEKDHPFRVTLGPGDGGRYIQRTHLSLSEAYGLRNVINDALKNHLLSPR